MADYEFVAAVDIGKWVSGLAVFWDSELMVAGEVRIPRLPRGEGPHPSVMALALRREFWAGGVPLDAPILWVVEKMVDYDGKGAREDDLEHLRASVEALKTFRRRGEALKEVRAAAWKGGTPKAVTAHRVQSILTPTEFVRVRPWTKETWDAVGLGLVMVGRARRGVVPL